jgi:hypothetical protein
MSVNATQDTAPVAGTSAGRYSFSDPVEWVSVRNQSGQPIYLLLNPESGQDAAADTADLELAASQHFVGRVTELGPDTLSHLSVFVATGGTVSQVYIRGA